MAAVRSLFILSFLLFSGCVAPLADVDTLGRAGGAGHNAPAPAPNAEVLHALHDHPVDDACQSLPTCSLDIPCTPTNCASFEAPLRLSPEVWSKYSGALEARLQVGGSPDALAALQIRDAAGAVLASSVGADGLIVGLPAPPTGDYRVEVLALQGTVQYEVATKVVVKPLDQNDQPTPLPPDLVPLAPYDFHIVHAAAGGAGTDETTSAEEPRCGDPALPGLRCLAMAIGIGNAGAGPLDLRLLPDPQTGDIPEDRRLLQAVQLTDGSIEAHHVGPGVYSPSHRHLHYERLAEVRLYPVDGDGRPAWPLAAADFNSCVTDLGVRDVAADVVNPRGYTGDGCRAESLGGGGLVMGLGAGWYTVAEAHATGNALDITGLPDGLYELVVNVNPDSLLIDANDANNEAAVVIELIGDTVRVVKN